MSTHWHKYPRLAENPSDRDCISAVETHLAARDTRYIPTAAIRRHYPQLQPGDIIAIATRVPGLDVTHTGLAYRQRNGDIGFIHAAPRVGVMLSPDLQTYVERTEDAIGILVARPRQGP